MIKANKPYLLSLEQDFSPKSSFLKMRISKTDNNPMITKAQNAHAYTQSKTKRIISKRLIFLGSRSYKNKSTIIKQ